MHFEELTDRRFAKQRRVAIENQELPRRGASGLDEYRPGLQDRMAGPQQLPLLDDGDGDMPIPLSCCVLNDLAHAIGLVADDGGNVMAGKAQRQIE